MRAIVLGAAAGGAFPQWNSNAAGCQRARAGDPAARPRTQASVAISADGESWVLLNASPDLRQQIEQTPALHPKTGKRSTPIAAVVLTGGDVDAIAGLLTMRERQAFTVFATARVHAVLDANPVFEVLARDVVGRETLDLEDDRAIPLPSGAPSGLSVRPFAVPGKVPLYLERAGETPVLTESEQTIGLAVTDGRATLFFIPGCASMTPALAARLRDADAVLFDGTLWTDDEMVAAGLGTKTGQRMGHMSVSGANGTIAAFADLGVRQRVLLHINNSNPILLDDSPERAEAEAAGWQVAYDGMELRL
jgi:pyrroloquinoline quinone biosynthesis protein B